MSTIAAMLGTAGPERTVEFDGRTYRFRRFDQAAMALYSERLVARVRTATLRAFAGQPEAVAAELRKLRDDEVTGYYEFLEEFNVGRPVAVPETRVLDGAPVAGWRPGREGGFVETATGQALLLSVLCGCGEGEVLALLVARREEVRCLLELTLSESLSGYRSSAVAQDPWKPGEPPKNPPAPPG